MTRLIPPGRSLTYYALLSWVIPGAAAVVVCVFAFFGSAVFQYRADQNGVASKLLDQSTTVARRVSSELLIGRRGSPDSVMWDLRESLQLKSVVLTSARPSCLLKEQTVCFVSTTEQVTAFREVPLVPGRYVELATTAPQLTSYFKLSNLLWSTFPVALMLGLGLLLQRLILRRFVLRPVQALVETSIGDREVRPHWPEEIRDIANRLYKSFEERDAAMFSQLVRGVIHDLRTLLQAPMAATELATEAGADACNNPDRRAHRLGNLELVCRTQLPKMKEIIDTTLDGSRAIAIQPRRAGIDVALDGVRRTLDPLLQRTGTVLTVGAIPEPREFIHDPIQLERALTNLAKNGIEAAAGESERPPQVEIRLTQDEEHLRIEIEDSGPGLRISPEKIFRPLKSTKPHGSGLGLVVTRNIVSAHGGSLVPGLSQNLGGAKFSVILPLARDAK